MSQLDIQLKFQPSAAFVGILAELNERFGNWTDGSYDWAAQTTDFLHAPEALPQFDDALWRTPLSRRALHDLLHTAVAMLSGQYPQVREYLQPLHCAFVIGYPRSGGSYLTKELLRTAGLDHTHVSEALAHDGFPELRPTWFDSAAGQPYFYLRDSIFQVAEFLVISSLYYRAKTRPGPDGRWLVPKKMHRLVHWGGSFKMLLGQGRADYLVTLRHPVPTCISVYEKSGGLPADGRFPVDRPRGAIEHWMRDDLMHLGYTVDALRHMSYFDVALASWANYYLKLATSGLFLGDRAEVRIVPYGRDALEQVVRDYRAARGNTRAPEAFQTHAKSVAHPDWVARAEATVDAVSGAWSALGLHFPALTLA